MVRHKYDILIYILDAWIGYCISTYLNNLLILLRLAAPSGEGDLGHAKNRRDPTTNIFTRSKEVMPAQKLGAPTGILFTILACGVEK
jgi:hypothetical protein